MSSEQPSTAEQAKAEMEAAREEVVKCEREIQSIKSKIKELGSLGGTSKEETSPNALELVVLKVEGLPESAQPRFAAQLSSPVEEQQITKLFDPLDPTAEGSVATFNGVDASVATLTLTAHDVDIPLGVSPSQDVAPLCSIQNVMQPQSQYVKEITLSILPEATLPVEEEKATEESKQEEKDTATKQEEEAAKKEEKGEEAEEETKDSAGDDTSTAKEAEKKEETAPVDAAKPKEAAPVVEPVCAVTLRAKYKPSTKDQREELYDLLNKASQKKSKALDRLRKSATASSRLSSSNTSTLATSSASSSVIRSGFLNKKNDSGQDTSNIMKWFNQYLGPQSLARRVFPTVKNLVIFFGAVFVFHFRGQELALPPPV